MSEENSKYTVAGTNVQAKVNQARKSGLSYNEAKEWIAKKQVDGEQVCIAIQI